MFCCNCGNSINDGMRFCEVCGTGVGAQTGGTASSSKHILSDIADHINRAAGIETPRQLKISSIFSEVFKKHTADEAEGLFIVGTHATTPNPAGITHTWPKPWLFAKVFLFVAIAYIGMYIGLVSFENTKCIPGLIFFGAFMIPVSLMIFFWEMNVAQNVSIYNVINMLFVGGVISLIITFIFYELAGDSSNLIVMNVIIGIVEEAGKLAAILFYVRNKKYTSILNGMLVGASIGAGFAALETSGYAFESFINSLLDYLSNNNPELYKGMLDAIFWRGILAPGGHIVWAALTGGALYMVMGSAKFEFGMLRDFRFVRVFAIVVGLHASWDYFCDMGIGNISGLPVGLFVLTLVSWIIVFAMFNAGLKQASHSAQTSQATPAVQSV